jgi:phosphonate transport system permease protein
MSEAQFVQRVEPPPISPELAQRLRTGRWLWLALAALLVWSAFGSEMSLRRLIFGTRDAFALAASFFPPDLSRAGLYFQEMLNTIKMAVWGSALATFLAVPLAFLGARNVVRHPVAYYVARFFMDGLRGLNELVLGLIFVAAIGLGPFPGILALTLHTAAVVGKLLSESIEAVDPGQVEAVQAAGGSAVQVLTHGIWPQVLPAFTSFTLYHFEVNVRAATVLGLVGAGGIGFYLQETMRSFRFNAAATVVGIIVIAVFLIDKVSAQLRRWLI